MPDVKRNLRLATIVYWVLLIYIVAALVWWALLLIQQNDEIANLQRVNIYAVSQGVPAQAQLDQIEVQRKRSFTKYLGEGSFFLFLILLGAVYIYRVVRKQFQVQLQQRNFLMAITHELKTPIAVSRLNLETLQKYNLDEARKGKLLQMTLQETMRLDTLINNILIASQLEGASYKLSKEEIDFSDLANDVLHQFSSRYPERKLRADIKEDVDINGDILLLKLLISNLLENANKYSPKDLPIDVNLYEKQGSIVLEVMDEGSGIPAAEKKNVFEKFYRVGNEETRRTQGTGLGLYLCKKITEDHDGQIEVKDNQPQGSKFIARFSV
jgi:two-component system, OmpR family, sensor histidine kinase CiaH